MIHPLAVSDPKVRRQLQIAGLVYMQSRAAWFASEARLLLIALESDLITVDDVDAKLEEWGALDLVYPEFMYPEETADDDKCCDDGGSTLEGNTRNREQARQ